MVKERFMSFFPSLERLNTSRSMVLGDPSLHSITFTNPKALEIAFLLLLELDEELAKALQELDNQLAKAVGNAKSQLELDEELAKALQELDNQFDDASVSETTIASGAGSFCQWPS